MPDFPLPLLHEVGAVMVRKDLSSLQQLLAAAPAIVHAAIPFKMNDIADIERTLSFPEVCVYCNWSDGIDLALQHEMDINAPAPLSGPSYVRRSNGTMLNYAITCEHWDLIRFLVGRGSDLTIKNDRGHTPLVAAWVKVLAAVNRKTCRPQLEVVHHLLDAGAPWNSDDPWFRHPVPAIAAPTIPKDSDAALVRALLEKGLRAGWDLNAVNHQVTREAADGRPFNALEAALGGGGLQMLLTLIREGADYNNLRPGVRLLDALAGKPEDRWFSWVNQWIPAVTAEILRREIANANPASPAESPSSRRTRAVL